MIAIRKNYVRVPKKVRARSGKLTSKTIKFSEDNVIAAWFREFKEVVQKIKSNLKH